MSKSYKIEPLLDLGELQSHFVCPFVILKVWPLFPKLYNKVQPKLIYHI